MLADKQNNNTVDFGAARARRVDISFNESFSTQRSNLVGLDNLAARLQTSLEIERLWRFFLDDIHQLIPSCALSYYHAETDAHLQLGEAQGFDMNYSLAHQGESLGELRVYNPIPFGEWMMDELERAISYMLFPVRNALLYRRAIQASLKDPLTGAGNRAALEQSLARETELSRRHGQALSVIMLDMDHFKNLNDDYGHQAGDAVLRATALLLKEQLRNIDMVFRFGGEEFVLVLSNTSSKAATVVAERTRAAIQNLFFLIGDKQVRLSASLGCATYDSCETQEDLLLRADQALYQAKRDGRNRIRAAAV